MAGFKNAATNGAAYGFFDSEGSLANQTKNAAVGTGTSLIGHQITRKINKNITVGFTNEYLKNIYNNSLDYSFGNLLEKSIRKNNNKD